jgi:hypothetical protein
MGKSTSNATMGVQKDPTQTGIHFQFPASGHTPIRSACKQEDRFQTTYIAMLSAKIYHAMLTQKNVVRIDTVDDAMEAGYHPTNDCNGNTATR